MKIIALKVSETLEDISVFRFLLPSCRLNAHSMYCFIIRSVFSSEVFLTFLRGCRFSADGLHGRRPERLPGSQSQVGENS
jgi:hypothetical protein